MLNWADQTGIKAQTVNLDEIVTPDFGKFASLTLTQKPTAS
jgi:hypothetical protein